MLYLQQISQLKSSEKKENIIIYLQKRNLGVPGIADKLYPPQERKLEKDISIDHFVLWSYVAHDEFWNLHPTTRSINSSKNNNLPDWDVYFPQLAKLEFISYEMMWKYDALHNEFEKCAKEHLNDNMVRRKIYQKGQDFISFSGALEEILQPVYQSAKNCGFKDWIYKDIKDH